MTPKAKQRELAAQWDALLKKHSAPLELGAKSKGVTRKASKKSNIPTYARITECRTVQYASSSLCSAVGNATKPVHQLQYTGSECIGVAVMHKSCLAPVFSRDDAVASARMRR